MKLHCDKSAPQSSMDLYNPWISGPVVLPEEVSTKTVSVLWEKCTSPQRHIFLAFCRHFQEGNLAVIFGDDFGGAEQRPKNIWEVSEHCSIRQFVTRKQPR